MSGSVTVSIQKDKCTGCGLCRLACSFDKNGVFNPNASRIWILDGDESGFYPNICRNCEEAPCLDACPAGALVRRREDGYILLNSEKCVGCNMCVMVCPFCAIGRMGDRNFKCDTCNHLEKCARICPHGAIQFEKPAHSRANKRRKLAGLLTAKTGGKEKW
ncbi:MAG: hypothetical protein HPY66_2989 [Firmicutes bacterium]|nr:hypothetical protein [Bacillota bacterium]